MNDPAISYDSNGNATVDTYGMDGSAVGTNDFGQPLYDIGGVTMTAEQAEENAHFFEAGDDGYGNNGWDQDYADETLPDAILSSLYRVNDALGGEGAAEFYADALLGIGDDRMDEVMHSTYMSRDEIESNATAIFYDMAQSIGIDHQLLQQEMNNDIAMIREMQSPFATLKMREILIEGVAGNYQKAMRDWDKLRGVLQSVR